MKFAFYLIFRGAYIRGGGLFFGGKFVLVIRGLIFGGLIFGILRDKNIKNSNNLNTEKYRCNAFFLLHAGLSLSVVVKFHG